MSTFKNLTELYDFFKTEDICKAYYEEKRWGGNPACPHCGNAGKIYRTNRGFKCGEKLCAKKFTVISGTIFENTKIGLRTWFAAMYLISTSKKGVSSLQLAEQLGITQKTGWFVNHRIREMLKEATNESFKGDVEIDETFMGGKNKNRHNDKKVENSQGRSSKDKTPVLGVIERPVYTIVERPHKVIPGRTVKEKVITKPARVSCTVISDTQKNTIQPLILNKVELGSNVYTDEWVAYNGLDKKYTHESVNHAGGVYVVGIAHTNGIENFWSTFKRGIVGIYHFISVKHLDRYCQEFSYRYNRRDLTGPQKFESALGNVDNKTLPYLKLIGRLTAAKLDSIAETLTKNPTAHPDSWLDDIDVNNLPIS